ncbi:hypothetical protein [Ruania alba]|uniref:Uncharacterized protein n=1 Tax=Ruania alba TaxID=648782 RepID=A0A1H5B5P7_9MICO|nr:hypothetical protein [Ruania alba]SED49913.1 hypothetical protein SAMN04488554_0019 [Ruania alba]
MTDGVHTDLNRRQFLAAGAAAGTLAGLATGTPAASAAPTRNGVTLPAIFTAGFPRSFHYRQSEFTVATTPYEQWAEEFSSLNGIIGKIVPEEKISTTGQQNVEYFTRFKRDHPDQLVLMHYNGRLRRPDYDPYGLFTFGGHWTYRAGTQLTRAVIADADEVVLHVADTSVFQMDVGRIGTVHDDIGIALMGNDGLPDWHHSEQVSLVDIDAAAGTITVRRGRYGTEPLAFPAGSYLAAHIVTGPWGSEDAGLIWWINFHLDAPRDSHGRNGIDCFVEDMTRRLGPGGELEIIDGVQFDIFTFTIEKFRLFADLDGDGEIDQGVIDGVNAYGLGQIEAIRRLREQLPDKLILTDGARIAPRRHDLGQRPELSMINGIEKEGFPGFRRWQYRWWSTVLGSLEFAQQRSREPSLSFINHVRNDERDYADLRLEFAAAQMVGIAINYAPKSEPDKPADALAGVLDEVWAGTDKQPNWLGHPLRPAQHLAERSPDLLQGGGVGWPGRFTSRIDGPGASAHRRTGAGGASMRVAFGPDAGDSEFPAQYAQFFTYLPGSSFVIPEVEVPGGDLVLAMTVSGENLDSYSPDIGRLLKVAVTPAGSLDTDDVLLTYIDSTPRQATLYFQNIAAGSIDLRFLAEGPGSVTLHNLRLHAGPDVMIREFEHGLVLANPSGAPHTFDLSALFPDHAFRRLQGTPEQDPNTNDGSPVGANVTLAALDGLALRRS